MYFIQRGSCEGIGANRTLEARGGDAQTTDQRRTNEVGIRTRVDEDWDLELGAPPGDTSGLSRLGGRSRYLDGGTRQYPFLY